MRKSKDKCRLKTCNEKIKKQMEKQDIYIYVSIYTSIHSTYQRGENA